MKNFLAVILVLFMVVESFGQSACLGEVCSQGSEMQQVESFAVVGAPVYMGFAANRMAVVQSAVVYGQDESFAVLGPVRRMWFPRLYLRRQARLANISFIQEESVSFVRPLRMVFFARPRVRSFGFFGFRGVGACSSGQVGACCSGY